MRRSSDDGSRRVPRKKITTNYRRSNPYSRVKGTCTATLPVNGGEDTTTRTIDGVVNQADTLRVLREVVGLRFITIGEAVKHLPAGVIARYPGIEWRKIAGLRDISVHSYYSVKPTILRDVIQTNSTRLKRPSRP